MKRWLSIGVMLGCSTGEVTGGRDTGDTSAPSEVGPDSVADAPVDSISDAPDSALSDSPTFVHAPNVNAMLTPDGTLLPLVKTGLPATPYVAFRRAAGAVTVLREDGATLSTTKVPDGTLFGGFDADGDGFPDFGVVDREDTGEVCGTTKMANTWLELRAGATGALLAATTKTKDLCWTFGATVYPTSQWTDLGLLFGDETKTVALSPYYAQIARFATWTGSAFAYDDLDYPSTAAFDAYPAARTNGYGTGKHTDNPHVANGLMMKVGGEDRLVFFTSGRVLQYAVGPHGPSQLRVDHPFLTAGRTDLVGRDYGLVARDPGDPSLVVLVSGTSIYSVYQDMVTAKMAFDPWGQIERHVTVYDTVADALDDRFYSYAHDGGDAKQYEGRVAYADHPFLRRPSGRSRLVYNVYEGGHWWLHVSAPGATADAWKVRGVVAWDVRDLDGDGVDEIVLSPVEAPTDPDVPGYYFPKWRTVLAHLAPDEKSLITIRTFDGAIPELLAFFREPRRTTSFSALYPALTVSQAGAPKLVLRKSDGGRLLVDP